MKKLNLKDILQYVEQNIGTFHQKRIQSLDGLKLSQMINKFTKEFANIFCKDNGEIDWDKLVRFNSATEEPKKKGCGY